MSAPEIAAEELRAAARCIDLSVADGLITEADAATLYAEALMPYTGEIYAIAALHREHTRAGDEPIPCVCGGRCTLDGRCLDCHLDDEAGE